MIPKCKHFRDCGIYGVGRCAINAYKTIDATITFGICFNHCTKYDGPARGLGDTIHKVVKTVTLGKIKMCGGCKERRVALNRRYSYAS